jgi:hypothetical protein
MRAAAEHLTPVLLELGGQNPAIVDETANLKDAARAPESFSFRIIAPECAIASLAYQRTASQRALAVQHGETRDPNEEVRDPFVLEFLNLRDEYSESDLEDALIAVWKRFCSSSATIFALWRDRSDCAWAPRGTGWIWSSFTAPCAAS